MKFSNLIDEIKKLSFEEKEEVYFLLKNYLIEEKREKIYKNYQLSYAEEQKGTLKFSASIHELQQILEEE